MPEAVPRVIEHHSTKIDSAIIVYIFALQSYRNVVLKCMYNLAFVYLFVDSFSMLGWYVYLILIYDDVVAYYLAVGNALLCILTFLDDLLSWSID